MSNHARRWRTASALTAAALVVASLSTGAAATAATRTATTYTDTSYLSDTLGVSSDTVIETVSYDRFQWLLQQSGQYAVLIGDPAEDSSFASAAQAVDAAAQAAGVDAVYWFDPNLTGSVTVGSNVTPALDIREPSAISTISSASQTVYGYAWTSLIAQYLGNGLAATVTGKDTESAKVVTATDASVVNDADDPLYDYSSGTPSTATDSTFFVYDKDNSTADAEADKLVESVDLTADPSGYAADVEAAFAAVGGDSIDSSDEFAFWESEINAKHVAQASAGTTVDGESILDDSDDADGWAVQQLTYPELVHLLNLKDSASQNFVILFGGTWCPNTRAVIKDVNAEAQDNGVTVYNFDTVLDGGTVGGGTTSSSNPLQVRNTANYSTTLNANPTYVYASILATYLKNIVTQYDLNNGSYVTYYPNGDTTKSLAAVRKLQVPFLINYQRGTATSPSSTAIKRQWIQQNTDSSTGLPTFKEYMTQYWYARPDAGRIGLTNSQFPFELEIPYLDGFDWESPSYPDTTTNADDADYLVSADATALATALAAVSGSSSLTTVADVTAAITAANAASTVDTTLVANLTTIQTYWTLAQTRKTNVTNALANVAFGLEAVAKLGTFFGGLPGGVVSTRTVTAPAVVYGTAPNVTVAIANDYGRVPTGDVTLTVNGASYTKTVSGNAASFTLPVLTPGSYRYTLSYPGDDQILAFTDTGTLTVVKSQTSSVSGSVGTTPTQAAAGSYSVAVSVPAGLVAATGVVTVTLTKGSTSSSYTAALSSGAATVSLPKLAAGTWAVATSWPGDSNYPAASTSGTITVAKVAAKKLSGSFTKKPTSKKVGKYTVRVTAATGVTATRSGKVTVTLAKGSSTKKVTGTLAKGKLTVTVPKLAKGTWKIKIRWAGNASYSSASAKSSVKITR
ncbi:MAG: Ig-like domain repeat protein [Microbacteriaceae bacterium]